MTARAMAPARSSDDGMPIAPALRWPAAMVLFAANLTVMLDMTVANVSVPHIAGNLGASVDQGAWVITSYAVAEAICIPLSGWLAKRFGEVRLFLGLISGFTVFSLLCGLSTTLPMLVAFRICQGLCGGPIMPLVQTLVKRVFPPEQLATAFAIWALTVMVGPAIGPVVGGLIVDQLSWHWIFFINVPIGVLCAVLGAAMLRPVETAVQRLPVDVGGMVLLVVWVGALQLMLDTGRDRDWFADPWIVLLAVVAVVGLCAFVVWELTQEHPAVNIRMLRDPKLTQLLVAISLGYGVVFSGTVILPQWLQVTMGVNATTSGWITMLSPVGTVIGSQIAMRLLGKVDARLMAWIGGLWLTASFVLRFNWNTDITMFDVGALLLFQGFGIPLLMMTLNNMSFNVIPADDFASGAGLFAFVRTMAMAIGVAVMLTLWSSDQSAARVALVGALDSSRAMAALTEAGVSAAAVPGVLSGMVDRQANTLGMLHVNMLAAIAVLLASSSVWFLPRIDIAMFQSKARD